MKLTPSQRAVIEHRGSNLLVAASAGAGKTEVLARRCVALIADPHQPCGIDRLLVVTFTRAAAAELRVRLARMLREEVERAYGAELRRHLRRQKLLVEAADIGTIDAWCGRIVREHFAEAGVDVGFTVLGEQDAKLLRSEVLDELLDGIHRGGDPLADEARAWMARGSAPDDGFLRDLVAGLNAFREHLVNPEQWFEQQRAACEQDDAEHLLAAALAEECGFQSQQLRAVLAGLPADAAAVLQPYCDTLADWQRRLADSGTILGVVDEIAAFDIPKPNRRKKEPPEALAVREARKRWLGERLQKAWPPEAIASILRHAPATAALAATLLRLEARYQQMLADAKRQWAAYEFADVLRMALDLLGRPSAGPEREPTDVARRLQRRYEHVLVDEYQDTSPVQVEILRLVTRDAPRQTNRFMVGDVKQSIYGFRQAEPGLFIALAEAFEAGLAAGRIEYLSDNFRSHAGLLAALNELFALLFDRALGGTPYGEKERLRAGRAGSEIGNPTIAGGPRVAVHVIEHDRRRGRVREAEDVDEAGIELIEREAQLAAEQINALLQAGVRVPERGADECLVLRPLRLADIVILLRSAVQNAGLVARVLRANGIPCVTSGRETMLDAVEVRDVRNVLELLVNRRQDVPLAAYLRSPLVGLTAAELLQVRSVLERRDGDFYEAVDHFRCTRPVAALAAKLDAALAQLDAWALAAREEELPAVLRRIFQDSGVVLLASALLDGAQRVALLRSLQNLASAVAGAGPGGTDDFVAYLDKLSAEEIDPGALAAGDEDVVRIMTIHGAKGLEFPVVFLLGAGAQFNRRRQQQALQCDRDVGLGLRFGDYRARATLVSARQHVIRRRVAQRELAEELRLLYVAATRAREHLVIVGHARPGMWDDCRAQYDGRRELPLISRLSVHNRLEWVLMATAAAGVHESTAQPLTRRVSLCEAGRAAAVGRSPRRRVKGQPALVSVVTHAPTDIHLIAPAETPADASVAQPTAQPEDDAWVERGRTLLAAEVGSVLADYPAALSVSALKELALRERGEDRPYVLDSAEQVLLRPAFAMEDVAADGRELGTACHRFLELADFARLASLADVESQLNELVAARKLSVQEAALVPVIDLTWFGTTAEGRLLARHADAARREVSFVYALPLALDTPPWASPDGCCAAGLAKRDAARQGLGTSGERTIVRGVIDCLLDTPDGLVVLDYKTDRVRDEGELAERLTGYQVQLQLYARAADAIFARPVARAVLVFLRMRQVIDVPLDTPAVSDLL